jgi:hypothetical protein
VRTPIKATAREPSNQAGYKSATSDSTPHLRRAAGPYKRGMSRSSCFGLWRSGVAPNRTLLRSVRQGRHRGKPAVRLRLTQRRRTVRISSPARQADRELRELVHRAINLDRAPVLLGDDVVADREAETGPLTVGLVVTNGWNSLSRISGAIPVPLSRTRISTMPSIRRVATLRVGKKSLSAVRLRRWFAA